LYNSFNLIQNYGNILLSNDRGKYKHTDIAVFDELPASVFEDPGPVDLLIEKIRGSNEIALLCLSSSSMEISKDIV